MIVLNLNSSSLGGLDGGVGGREVLIDAKNKGWPRNCSGNDPNEIRRCTVETGKLPSDCFNDLGTRSMRACANIEDLPASVRGCNSEVQPSEYQRPAKRGGPE